MLQTIHNSKRYSNIINVPSMNIHSTNDHNHLLFPDSHYSQLLKENTELKERNVRIQTSNDLLKLEIQKYEKKVETLSRYDLGNLNGLNEEQLKRLEMKMTHNLSKIRAKRESLIEDQLLCMICYTNKKNIVIQGCNHFDICDICLRSLPQRKCPRCQASFRNTIKLNHLNV